MQKGVFNSRACLSELGWRFKVKKGSIWLGLGPYSLWFNSSNKDSVIVRGIKVKERIEGFSDLEKWECTWWFYN